MAIKKEYKTIDGTEYTVSTFPARRGLKLKFRLARKLTPALAELFKNGIPDDALDLDIDAGAAASAFASVFASIDDDEAEALTMALLAMTRHGSSGGEGGVEMTGEFVDSVYSGEYLSLYKVLAFVIKVNYGSFLKGADLFRTSSPKKEVSTPDSETLKDESAES